MGRISKTARRMTRWPETTYAANIVGEATVLPFLPGTSSMLAWAGEYLRHVPGVSPFARAGLGIIAAYNGYEAFDALRNFDFTIFPVIDAFARGLVTYHSARGALNYGVRR